MSIWGFLFGRKQIAVKDSEAARFLNLCMDSGFCCSELKLCGREAVVECGLSEGKRLLALCEKRGVSAYERCEVGLPCRLRKLIGRVGLVCGSIFAVFIITALLSRVWRIDVSGNSALDRGEIEKALAECGFYEGCVISDIRVNETENMVLDKCPDISWISINISGTVARVEVRETVRGEPLPSVPADLVAKRDGVVERIEAYSGKIEVKQGDLVRAGQLLVSGFYENEKGEKRVTRANGEIFARTVRSFEVEIPYKNTEKVYTGSKKTEIYIKFFKKYIKVFSNSGNLHTSCDIIDERQNFTVGDLPPTPVGIVRREYLEYETAEVVLSEAQAMEAAFDQLEEWLDALSPEIELLEKRQEFLVGEESYLLKCTVVCVENIAISRDIILK